MSFVSEILNRPTIKAVTDFFLYGESSQEYDHSADYHTRITKAYQCCEKTLLSYENNKDSDLYVAIDELLSEYEKVYMEMGLQCGILLVQDALKQSEIPGENKTEELTYCQK